ncbi:peptide-methionine (S)-S-oxide reductase MsrA [Aestuariivirga sp.]|uniref:peptide-methionine (S)-S-oxide reductase MsrA n=1 Tax=Aestuariivirga sp. TaxID=2650926 RepID=UPI0039E2A36C
MTASSLRIRMFSACAAVALGVSALASLPSAQAEEAVKIAPPAMLEPAVAGAKLEKAVLAGGCFWGMQAVFQHVKGVKNVMSGYAGGAADTAQYETVSGGDTGHAESVEITFDPSAVNYATLLQIYFSVGHNPTELNFQGPDTGTQYRSAIFPMSDAQAAVAAAYIKQLDTASAFPAPIVTRIEPGKTFYPAEDYHQDYATLHPDSPYIAINDLPKVDNLSRLFPDLYSPRARLVKDSKVSG